MVLRQNKNIQDTHDSREIFEKDIDERVKIRCHYFLHPEERLTTEQIDERITIKALEESAGSSLSDIVGKVVKEFAFNVAKLDLDQFLEAFQRNSLSRLITHKFVQSLSLIDQSATVTDTLSPEIKTYVSNKLVREIRRFLSEGGLVSAETLHDLIKQKKAEYPDISMHALFHEELSLSNDGEEDISTNLINILTEQIDNDVKKIAEAAYKEKFNADKRGFVMGFVMGNVIKYNPDSGEIVFSSKDFYSLMTYLDGLGFNIARIDGEGFYDWLYEESRAMATYLEQKKVESERYGVRNSLSVVVPLAEEKGEKPPGFLNADFNVQKFYQENVFPKLFRFYSKKLKKLKKVREPDFLSKMNDPNNDISANYTTHLMRYLQVLHNTYREDSADFIAKVRELFGLNDSPLLKSLSHKEVLVYIEQYLDKAREKMEAVRKEALLFRMNDAELVAACDYPNEIKGCKNLATLIGWVLNPEDFLRTNPQYRDWTELMVRSAAGTMIRDFLIVSKELSSERFSEVIEKRDLSEKRMLKTLNIKILDGALPVDFRLMKASIKDKVGGVKTVSKVVFSRKKLGNFIGSVDGQMSDRLMSDPGITQVDFDNLNYQVYPIERKMFCRAQITVPVMVYDEKKKVFRKNKKPRVIEVLIYIGGDNSGFNDQLIHNKGGISMVMSQDRGKEVSDKTRWMVCCANEEDEDLLRDFLYSDNARSILKADDPKEGRKLSNKNGKNARTKSSESFKEHQAFSIAKTFYYPRKNTKGELEIVEAGLETQCQGLEDLIASNLSHYSETSHDIYKAQRSWPKLFSSYFPPEIFGDKYKEFQTRGYRVD